MQIGIALIGYGGIGRLHALCLRMLPLLYPQLPPIQLVAVQTASQSSAERAARELDGVITSTRLDQILSLPNVHVIDCCAPTADHASIAAAALAAGKALFCEKPLSATAEQSQQLVDQAQLAGLTAGVNFHFRQLPALQEAHRLIKAGILGDLISTHLRYYRSSNLNQNRALSWRFHGPGSGVLADLGSHLIDLTMHFFGPIQALSCELQTLVTERRDAQGQLAAVEADDVAWLQARLAGGGRCSIEASKLVPGAADDIRIEAYGRQGALCFDMRDPNGLQIMDGTQGIGERRIAMLSRTTPAASLPGPETSTATLLWHAASLYAFLSAYAEGRPASPSFRDGLAVDQVIAAARQAAREGQSWVQVTKSKGDEVDMNA